LRDTIKDCAEVITGLYPDVRPDHIQRDYMPNTNLVTFFMNGSVQWRESLTEQKRS